MARIEVPLIDKTLRTTGDRVLRADLDLEVKTNLGTWHPFTFLVDPGTEMTTMPAWEARRRDLPIPKRPVRGLSFRGREVRRGLLRARIPGLDAAEYVLPCYFLGDPNVPMADPKNLLGLTGVIDKIRLTVDGTTSLAAPNGLLIVEKGGRRSMAKQEFLDNVRLARKLFSSPDLMADDPSLDPQARERLMLRRAIWLTPKSVGGFNVDDFKELGPDRQRELADAVRDFLDVAKQVPPTATPTKDQHDRAAAALGKILDILAPYVPMSPEEERFREAVKGLAFPDWVVNWSYQFEKDYYDEPMIRVTLFIDEQTAPRFEMVRFMNELSSTLYQALSRVGIDDRLHVHVNGALEHKKRV
jgi:hypothetical protein